jgi:stearoyl-CoA desaturase (Delta-9 desaturase)
MLNFKNGFNWGPALFLIVYQIVLLAALPVYFYFATPSISLFVITFVLLYITGLSITGGYHRFYSHRTFKTNRLMEWVLLFFGSMAGQGSALRWSFDHRNHHAHVDTDEDPYSIKKGFWYAHFLWILEKPSKIESKTVSDLLNNRLVVLQDRYYALFFLGTNILAFLTVGWLLNDYLGALVLAVGLRLFLLHHFTWFINSLAHTWGDKPFSQEHSAVNNYIISLLTFGEGYHNYHHTFANDYRNGIYWYQFDPTKWLIWILSKCGLVKNLRRMDKFTIKKRLVIEHKQLLIDRLKQSWADKCNEWEPIVNELSDKLVAKISDFSQLKNRYYELKAQCSETTLQDLKREMKELKKSLRHDWKQWSRLSRAILAHA